MVLWGFITLFLVNHSSLAGAGLGCLAHRCAVVGRVVHGGQPGRVAGVHGRNVVAQPRPPVCQPTANDGAARRSVHEPGPHLIGVGGAALVTFRCFIFPCSTWAAAAGVLCQSDRHGLGNRSGRFGHRAALRTRCRAWPGSPSSPSTRERCVLPRLRSAGWFAVGRLGAAVQPCVRGMRAVLIDHHFRSDLLLNAALLNLVYLAAGLAVFLAYSG